MAQEQPRISKISVRGFKSIGPEQAIAIRPLTLLGGANSAGKSSMMQPVLLLKQTIEALGDPGALALDGPYVWFNQAEQLLSKNPGAFAKNEFAARIELNSGECFELVFRQEEGVGFQVASMLFAKAGASVVMTPDMDRARIGEIIKILPEALKLQIVTGRRLEKESFRWSVQRERCFLTLDFREETGGNLSFGPFVFRPAQRFVPNLQSIIHLPGLRGNPLRTYSKSAFGPSFPGPFQTYAASLIAQWQATGDSKFNRLGDALEDMGLTWKVKADPVDDIHVELRVGRLSHSQRGGAHDLVSVADVGFGVSQVLPVVVALIAAKPGQVVYLEQPEIHLHPRAQRKLVHVMAAAAKRGVLVVAETHSSLVLKEIQTMVATGGFPKEHVMLHWFQRKDDGNTAVTSAELDDKGAYGAWPEDFDDVELQAENAYLNAVESQGAQ